MQGLSQGLTRIWCGGTALAESISFAGNKSVPSDTFDEFFLALVDPASQAWPGEAPPPPNFAYLQELDMRNTCALGPGFVAFAQRTIGLRTLRVSAVGGRDEECIGDVLRALASVNAPLETFHGNGFGSNIIQPIFLFFHTLREVKLGDFAGDAGLLLNGWPQPVPKLALSIGHGSSVTSGWAAPSLTGHSPGSLDLTSDGGFGISALETLRWSAPGLKKLTLCKMAFWQLDGIAQLLSMCGLEALHVTLPVAAGRSSPRISQGFFASLAQSRTLKDLQLPGQLVGSDVAHVGRFLRTNRSVNCIGFDSPGLVLDAEGVKELRGAFYGNKKGRRRILYLRPLAQVTVLVLVFSLASSFRPTVASFQSLTAAGEATRKSFRVAINKELELISTYKLQIKRIFQR